MGGEMKIGYRALVALTCVLLTACAPVPLQRAQIGGLARDSSPADVDRVLGKATAVAQTEFAAGGQSFRARHYRLQSGTKQEMTMVCTPTCIPIFVAVPITAEYVVIQRLPSQQLHAWGTLEELSKDPDDAVSTLMPTVKARYEEAKKKP